MALVDTLHYLLQTLLAVPECRGLASLVPELQPMARAVEARHVALEAGCPGAQQMSFACAAERLPAA